MKKYNQWNFNMILLGMIVPILVFFGVSNVTYAYFTAKAHNLVTSTTTGILIVSLSDDTSHSISTSVSNSENLFPGDSLVVSGSVVNKGTTNFFAVLQLDVTVTKQTGVSDPIITKFYTIVDNVTILIEKSQSDDTTYLSTAFTVEPERVTQNNYKDFELEYLFDGNLYDNSYANATINYSIKALAIQTSLLTAQTATAELIENLAVS